MEKQWDREYQDKTITAVNGTLETGFQITCDDGWSFWVEPNKIEPRIGDPARFYGRGLGSIVRGLTIRGVEIFYRSPQEQEAKNKQELADAEMKRCEDFEAIRAELDAVHAILPEPFRRRIDRLRANNPDFRWQYERYEMFVCEQAALMVAAFPSAEQLQAFQSAEWEEQRKMMPNLSGDHSGNSFGAACRLAYWAITEPANVEIEHGAMCPLVGCKDYGCAAIEAKV